MGVIEMDMEYERAVNRLKDWVVVRNDNVKINRNGQALCAVCGSVLDDGRIMEWDDPLYMVHKAIRMFWCPKCRLKEGSAKPAMRHIEYAKTWEDGV